MISNHPSKWTEDELFKAGERLAKGLVVVNDMAERGMALIQDVNPLRARGAIRRHLKTFFCEPEVPYGDISGAPTKTGDVWEPAVFQC